jgi:hypothetical protein
MAVIRVHKPQEGSFNKNRPVSALLKAQIRHLQEVEFNTIKTEGQASDYIRRITALLHPTGAPRVKPRKAMGKVIPAIAAEAERKATRRSKPKPKERSGGGHKTSKKKA